MPAKNPLTKIKKFGPMDRLIYWINERESVRKAKEASKDPPWTDDPIIQTTYFTNVNRDHDRVTRWLKNVVMDSLKGDDRVLFAILAFRWFNYIPTGELLVGIQQDNANGSKNLLVNWNTTRAIRMLNYHKEKGRQIFTGAFTISPSGSKKGKIERVCEDYIDPVWENLHELLDTLHHGPETLEFTFKELQKYPGLKGSGFMAAQVIADLKHTHFLKGAPDWWSWCCLGPGSKRGLNRVMSREPDDPPVKNWHDRLLGIQRVVQKKTGLELCLQNIQNCLCEFDKYERILWGQGRSKRTYPGA